MSKKDALDKIDAAMGSAAMEEKGEAKASNDEKKRKIIQVRVEDEKKIKAKFPGSFSTFINLAIKEKMERDGY